MSRKPDEPKPGAERTEAGGLNGTRGKGIGGEMNRGKTILMNLDVC